MNKEFCIQEQNYLQEAVSCAKIDTLVYHQAHTIQLFAVMLSVNGTMILWRVSKRAPKVYGKCDELTYLSGKRTEHIVRSVCQFCNCNYDKLLQEAHEEVILYEVKTSAFSLESRFIDFFYFPEIIF